MSDDAGPVSTQVENIHSDNHFPYLRIRENVALIGVNSARATLPLMATGYFRFKQAVRLANHA